MAPRKKIVKSTAPKTPSTASKAPRKATSPATPKKSAIGKGAKRDDKPLTKDEEKRAVRLRMDLEAIISTMRNERDIYGSLLQDLIPVRDRLEDLTDIIKTGQTITELRKASRALKESEPEVWKKLFEEDYELPDLGTPSPEPESETPTKKTPGGRKRKGGVEDKEFKAPASTPAKKLKGKGGSSPKVEVTAASTRPQRKRK